MVEESKLLNFLQRRNTFQDGTQNDPRDLAQDMINDGVLTNFQAEQFLLGKWRGFTIGKYKLLERIGVGGMGQVFLCEHMFMKRRVAIKVLPPAKAEQPAALGRFYREARAAGSLEHPNIVRTHDIDQDGNLHFIVMEYVDGSNLLDVVKRFGPLDFGRAVSYCYQVAVALDYAFRAGIIHRDVKPGNILIDRRGRAKVLDMGLARFFRDQNDLLTVKYDDKIVLGTADYVAPEQVANSHSVDVRADIYGMGCTLYFLLAGHPPFPTGSVSQKLLWHRTKEPTPIAQVRADTPPGLAAIIAQMMAKDPRQRYQTPAEVALALQPWIPGNVPLPRADEMPSLCPAVLDSSAEAEVTYTDTLQMTDEPTNEPAGVSTEVVSAQAGKVRNPAYAGASPFGRPQGSRAAVMTPPHVGQTSRSPGGAIPFGSGSLPGDQPTPPQLGPASPLPYTLPNAPSSHPLLQHPQSSFNVGPTEPVATDSSIRYAVLALVVAMVILGAGLLYWKLGE